MNKDLLKKHHFWILFAPFAVCVLVAVMTIWTGIGSKIEAREKEIDTAEKAAKGKQDIKPLVELTILENENTRVGLIRFDKWRENWDLQIGVVEYGNAEERVMKQEKTNQFRWPVSDLFTNFNYRPDGYTDVENPKLKKPKFKGLKFGADVPNDRSERLAFKSRDVYLAEYSNATLGKPGSGTGMADRLWPTQFAGGWSSVLRHVYVDDPATGYGWGQGRPTSPEIWLALEDLWIQRSLLNSLRTVNEDMASFAEVAGVAGRKTFVNRTWKIEVWAMTRASDNKRVLVGTLTNLSPRIQTFGLGGKLTFQVQLDAGGPPIDLVFNERYLTGAGGTKRKQEGNEERDIPGDTMTITPDKGTDLTTAGANVNVKSIRQVFDTRTVPLQRIDRLVLGYPDGRLAGMGPKLPLFLEVPADAVPPMDDGSGGVPPVGSIPRPPGSGDGGPGGPGGGGTSGGMVGAGWPVVYGPVTSKMLLETTKKRYLQVTNQVRRMPVGMVLIVDQTNLQDVLLALANSPLRFQITQVHWQRYRGLPGGDSTGGGSYPGSTGGEGGGLNIIGSPDGGPGGGRGPGINISGGNTPMGTGTGTTGIGGEPGFADADIQMTSGLIEVSIYGIVSLYEKYEPELAQPQEQDTGFNP